MVLDEPFDQAIGIAAAPLIQISSDISKKRAVLRYKDWIGSKIGHLIFVRPRYSPADRPRPKPLSVPNALLRLMFFFRCKFAVDRALAQSGSVGPRH